MKKAAIEHVALTCSSGRLRSVHATDATCSSCRLRSVHATDATCSSDPFLPNFLMKHLSRATLILKEMFDDTHKWKGNIYIYIML